VIPILAGLAGGMILDPPLPPPLPPPDPQAAAQFRQVILDSLLPGQRAVCEDTTHRTVAFVAGLGAGKTRGLSAWTTLLALDNPGTTGAVFAPTGPLVRDVVQRSLVEFWDDIGATYTYRASPLPEYELILPTGAVTVLCRSMENWTRIIGMNLSFIGCDEIDTTKITIARLAVQRFFGRLRAGDRRQLGLFSTPEGFGLLYSMFVEEGDKDDRALYKGKTADNPYLPADYLETLLAEYPANLVKAYTEGEFVSMASAGVYPDFDREKNKSDLVIQDDDTLWVGVDFNVDRCWMVVIVRYGGQLHVVAEHIARDTPACIELLNREYGSWIARKQLVVCPDASARNRNALDAGIASIGMMKRTSAWGPGLRLQYQQANPFIKDRVLSVNAQILNGLGERNLRVHPSCKGVLRGLEQHSYDLATQQPQKGDGGVDDLSGQMDALGYAVWQLAGIKPWITGGTRVEVW
jgi:hypothetical protein